MTPDATSTFIVPAKNEYTFEPLGIKKTTPLSAWALGETTPPGLGGNQISGHQGGSGTPATPAPSVFLFEGQSAMFL